MSVTVTDVEKGSPADKAGIKPLDTVVSINGEEIDDVLDYRFYQDSKRLEIEYIPADGSRRTVSVSKGEYEELGLLFETYLMDTQRSCMNKCVFCFIDQLPRGLRESLYFKDDDSRLSFLFGNYITLTNLTEHEIERIIKMHISPVNISVHTTNPELRVRMMANKNAGKSLGIIDRLDKAGIRMNCQLVLCPGYNDGEELDRTLSDLTAHESIECIAAVPVGLTRFREGLAPLEPFNRDSACAVLDIIDRYAGCCTEKYGDRRVYGSDEFYLLSGRKIPGAEFYGEFMQLENGVGLWSLLRDEAEKAVADSNFSLGKPRSISLATGVAAYPLIKYIVDLCLKKWHNLNCRVFAVKNDFFGERITVAGLVTATDLTQQLKGEMLGDELLIPSVMLRREGDMFLDSVTVEELSARLGVRITPVGNDGYELVERILGL